MLLEADGRSVLESLELLDDQREFVGVVLLAMEPSEEGCLLGRLRLRVNHLDDVAERGIVSRALTKELLGGLLEQEVLHEALRTRTERRAAGPALAHELHEVAEHLHVVDDARERERKELPLTACEHGKEKGGRVLHEAFGAPVDRELREEDRRDLLRECGHTNEGVFGALVERSVEGAGHDVLRQLVLGGERVGRASLAVHRVGLRRRALDGRFPRK